MKEEFTIVTPPYGATHAVTTFALDEYGDQHPVTLAKTKAGNVRAVIDEHITWPMAIRSYGMLTAFQVPHLPTCGMMRYLVPYAAWQAVIKA